MTKQTILITGASRGFGLASARAFAQRGWRLIINGRDPHALKLARAELAAQTEVVAIAGDITHANHRTQLAQAAHAAGGVDVLINNASTLGVSPLPNLVNYPLAALEGVYQTNVFAPLALIQATLAALKPNARIVNISSDAAVEAYAGWGGYGASKAALEQMSAILAAELAPALDAENPHIKVYWVDPGDMQTQMHQEAFPGEDISDRPLPETSVPGLLALLDRDLPSGRYKLRDL